MQPRILEFEPCFELDLIQARPVKQWLISPVPC